MGRPTRGGSAGGARNTSTGAALHPAFRSARAASSATAPTPNTTATATPTRSSGKSARNLRGCGCHGNLSANCGFSRKMLFASF